MLKVNNKNNIADGNEIVAVIVDFEQVKVCWDTEFERFKI